MYYQYLNYDKEKLKTELDLELQKKEKNPNKIMFIVASPNFDEDLIKEYLDKKHAFYKYLMKIYHYDILEVLFRNKKISFEYAKTLISKKNHFIVRELAKNENFSQKELEELFKIVQKKLLIDDSHITTNCYIAFLKNQNLPNSIFSQITMLDKKHNLQIGIYAQFNKRNLNTAQIIKDTINNALKD